MSGSARATRAAEPAATPTIKMATGIIGAVFLLVGVLGFIPGVTTNFSTMTFAGHEGDALLLGIFQVSILHNIVHLLFGIAGLLAMRTVRACIWYLLIGGAIYLVLWLYGLIIDANSSANFVPVNDADNWLHLGLGVLMVVMGIVAGRSLRTRT